ncbi:MAG: hypothetical protein ACMUHX_02510 [bacterium]
MSILYLATDACNYDIYHIAVKVKCWKTRQQSSWKILIFYMPIRAAGDELIIFLT